MKLRRAAAVCVLAATAAVATPAAAQGLVPERHKWLAFLAFVLVIGLTLVVTYLASRRIRTASDFYTAGHGVSGLQNGWAIAGDYLSAASFLGVSGLISLYGYDGFMYSVGWLVAYITVLLAIAEPCRNIGTYTLADVLAFRNDPRISRVVGALSTLTVSAVYLVAQMVAGGLLIKALIGIDYEVSVVAVGILMLVYVICGGMLTSTYVQIIKAVLLVATSLVLVVCVWLPYGFSLPDFLIAVVGDAKVQAQVAGLLGDPAARLSATELGQRFLEPGLYFTAPLDQFSLGLALVFGTAGLPHILMRFFTVPTAREARRSVIWAMGIIGGFYLLTLFLGMGAALRVGPQAVAAADEGGNLAAPLLAQYLGGGPESLVGNLALAFVAAVAFATIVAVVTGLLLAASSAVAHDLYLGVLRHGVASPQRQIRVARLATVLVGGLAIVLGLAAKGQNVAHLVALAFAIAASANFPCILLTLYWRRCNTAGIVAGMLVGTLSALLLVPTSSDLDRAAAHRAADTSVGVASPAGGVADPLAPAASMSPAAGETPAPRIASAHPLLGLRNPGLLSIPLGFLAVVLGSLCFRDRRALAMWEELRVRQNTGILVAKASGH